MIKHSITIALLFFTVCIADTLTFDSKVLGWKSGDIIHSKEQWVSMLDTLRAVIRRNDLGAYAGIHVHDTTVVQSIPAGTTYTKVLCYVYNDSAANCTPDAANDKITITKTGSYYVSGSFSFKSNTNNVVFRCAAFLGGVEQNDVHWLRKIGTGADAGSSGFVGIISVQSVPIDIDVRVRHDQVGATEFNVLYSNFVVNRIGR